MGNAIKLLGLLACLQLIACDLGYYAHLAQGQARIIWRTQPAAAYKKIGSTPDSVKGRFVLVDSILHFAHTIGLKSKGQYTKFYDTGGDPISWNVSAAPQNSFTPYIWHFPLVPMHVYVYESMRLASSNFLCLLGALQEVKARFHTSLIQLLFFL